MFYIPHPKKHKDWTQDNQEKSHSCNDFEAKIKFL